MSKNQKNNYPLEFKTSAVKLAVESDQSIAQIARDLGINDNTLYSWVNKYSNSNKINQNNMANNENSFEEIKRLKKELTLVKQERDLLKKAAAYFAKESQ
jgi:transposase